MSSQFPQPAPHGPSSGSQLPGGGPYGAPPSYAPPTAAPARKRRPWLLPTVTGVVGLMLGALAAGGDDEQATT